MDSKELLELALVLKPNHTVIKSIYSFMKRNRYITSRQISTVVRIINGTYNPGYNDKQAFTIKKRFN